MKHYSMKWKMAKKITTMNEELNRQLLTLIVKTIIVYSITIGISIDRIVKAA